MSATPYYDVDGITLYHGDNLDVMPLVGQFDLVFTSPPYNLGAVPTGFKPLGHWKPGAISGSGGRGAWKGGANSGHGVEYGAHDDAMPWDEYVAWQKATMLAMDRQLTDDGAIFYVHKPRTVGTRLWRPDALVPDVLTVRCEIVWDRGSGMNFTPTAFVPNTERILVIARDDWRIPKGQRGIGDVWRIPADTSTEHPAPFPVALPSRALTATKPHRVLDPYAGSGSTLLAAKAAGITAVGIEKDERWCELIVRRLDAGVQSSLFLDDHATQQGAR